MPGTGGVWPGFFLYLALDEGVELHEMTIHPLRNIFGTERLFLLCLGSVSGHDRTDFRQRFTFASCGICPLNFVGFLLQAEDRFITGAAGMEMVGGHVRKVYGLESIQYVSETIMEESLEMTGILIFIYALLSYLSHYVKEFQLQFFEQKS